MCKICGVVRTVLTEKGCTFIFSLMQSVAIAERAHVDQQSWVLLIVLVILTLVSGPALST